MAENKPFRVLGAWVEMRRGKYIGGIKNITWHQNGLTKEYEILGDVYVDEILGSGERRDYFRRYIPVPISAEPRRLQRRLQLGEKDWDVFLKFFGPVFEYYRKLAEEYNRM